MENIFSSVLKQIVSGPSVISLLDKSFSVYEHYNDVYRIYFRPEQHRPQSAR
jgi:hypothetical protein